jgi:hypothetical protein
VRHQAGFLYCINWKLKVFDISHNRKHSFTHSNQVYFELLGFSLTISACEEHKSCLEG